MYSIQFICLSLMIYIFPISSPFGWIQGQVKENNQQSVKKKQGNMEWERGTYRGITIGVSTTKELIRKWGKPKRIGHFETDDDKHPEAPFWKYDVKDNKYSGEIEVGTEARAGKVTYIQISLSSPISTKKAIELFGDDYKYTRYQSCICADPDNEVVPMYESPKGNTLYLEYRRKGMSLYVSMDTISSIDFNNRPIGLKSESECKKDTFCYPQPKRAKIQPRNKKVR